MDPLPRNIVNSSVAENRNLFHGNPDFSGVMPVVQKGGRLSSSNTRKLSVCEKKIQQKKKQSNVSFVRRVFLKYC